MKRLWATVFLAAVAGCAADNKDQTQESCPATMPVVGTACVGDAVCLYDSAQQLFLGEYNCEQVQIACREGSYQHTGLHCDPPAPATECPPKTPAANTTCSGDLKCLYDFAGDLYTGTFNCEQIEYLCRDGVFGNSGMHCDPM